MSDPPVTVLLLTYNQRGLLDRALTGILEQRTEEPFRILVHDDASTDGTRERLLEVAAQHPDVVELVLPETNQLSQGVSISARLLLRTRSEFVALCEGDDYWTDPTKLQRQVDFLRENPWCSVCHHEFTIRSDGGRADYEAVLRDYLARLPWRTAPRAEGRRLALGNFVRTCTAMLRRSALREEVLRAAHDVRPGDHLLFTLAAEQGDVGFIDRDMATYRLHPQGSWAMLDPHERTARQLGVYWFLAAHLRGPMQDAVRDMLLRMLVATPAELNRHPVLRELADRAGRADRLGDQVTQLAEAGTRTADALEATLARAAELERRLAALDVAPR